MKRVVFKNQLFYGLLLAFIIALLLYNLYVTIFQGNLYGLIPVFIQTALLITILTKDKNAKLFIQIWVIAFLLVSSGLEITGSILDGFGTIKLNQFIFEVFKFGTGLFILDYTRRTVAVVFSDSVLNVNLERNDSVGFDETSKKNDI